ncbi:MAG: CDP-alcohol phosphatidyltransferase family protein [Gemmatimonadaceae bacterium]|nr:CDP-alcohol phosphatidyltransferase family protein [Gemmatimonadaceae bacterium]MCC6433204.1 CDP-alcohol phosphatidyltransferase family protein [Gemmatimonadaceae bacterium]
MPAADLLTLSRAVAAVLMMPAALFRSSTAVLWLLAWSLISDALDGPIARARGTASTRGAQRDSLADCLLYSIAPIAGWYALPHLRAGTTVDVIAMVAAYVLPISYGFVKFRRLTSYHTVAARAATCLVAVSVAMLVFADVRWLLHAAVALLVLSAIEEIAITHALSAWTSPVRSWRALHRSLLLQVASPPPAILPHSSQELSCIGMPSERSSASSWPPHASRSPKSASEVDWATNST